MWPIYVLYKISVFYSVKTLNTLVNMKSPLFIVPKKRKNALKCFKCQWFECPHSKEFYRFIFVNPS